MLLANNPRFLNEYKVWSSKIDKIKDERIKKELEDLLRKLVEAVRAIDLQHQEILVLHRMPDGLGESKGDLVSIRKKIQLKLDSCEKAGLL
jgi:hypothetical protein